MFTGIETLKRIVTLSDTPISFSRPLACKGAVPVRS